MEQEKIISLNYDENFKKVLSFVQFKSGCGDYLHKNKILEKYIVPNNADYLSLEGDMVTYMPGEKLQAVLASGDDPWTSKKRGATRFGRIVLRIFKSGIFDSSDIERFANSIKWYHTMEELDTLIIEGNEIIKWYDFDSYADRVGSLGNSCMKYKECQNYFSLYVDNPETVKMVLLKTKENRIVGRALLWYGENFKFMDRVYVNYDHHYAHFTDWAKENGYIHKQKQSWNTPTFFKEDGVDVEMELSIQFKNWRYEYYPYLDTFKWLNLETGVVTNYKPENKDNIITISSGGGNHTNYNHLVMDDFTRMYWNRDNMVAMKYLDNRLSYMENTVYSECNNVSLLSKDAKWDEEASDYIFNEEYNGFNNWTAINERKDRNRLGGLEWKTLEVKKSRRRGASIYAGYANGSLFTFEPSTFSGEEDPFGIREDEPYELQNGPQGAQGPQGFMPRGPQDIPQGAQERRSRRRSVTIDTLGSASFDDLFADTAIQMAGTTMGDHDNHSNPTEPSDTLPDPNSIHIAVRPDPNIRVDELPLPPQPQRSYERRREAILRGSTSTQNQRLRDLLNRYSQTSNDAEFLASIQRLQSDLDEADRVREDDNRTDEVPDTN